MTRTTDHRSNRRSAPRRVMRASLVAVLAVLLVGPAAVGADDSSAAAEGAVAWLDAELAANSGELPGFMPGTTDWGLMGDFALARIATGRGAEPATRAQAQKLLDNLGSYSTWDDQGPEFAGVRISGALAKVYLVAIGAGLETDDVGGVDLEAEMRSLMNPTGDQAGRFSDRNPYGPDYSLALSQSWAMMALAHTADGVPREAVSFLAAQQCPGGGFRLVYDDALGCTDDSEADPDATALAVQVLLGLDRDEQLETVVSDAVEWLVARQEPDGSFGGGKYTEAPNANSTGLIAQTLRAVGRTAAADSATAWITGQLQLGSESVGTPAEADRGAVAYDPAGRAAALESGIADAGRDQWRRATSQAVLGLGAALFVDIVDEPSTDPTGTTTTTAVPTPDDTTPGGTTAAGGVPQVAGEQVTTSQVSGGAALSVTG